ncbi:glycerate kinase [Corynebacterium renale]|uniref:glycerate kinase family protein n=1 Tax=Corynebacterium renale TaxID=1724 RepID=UPI000DA39408|nr:glycerate kinase [Corynebacterium renale]SQG63477.1 glycerate kinase [Corynebacterium renale]STD00299.1 glycerate kinase [Corynebacterium renale]
MTMYLPARILVAPSGFKESLSAVEVAESIAAGVRRVLPGVRVDLYPVPDGGEGTVEILADRPGAVTHAAQVTGPVGQQVQATWLEFPDQGVAVMEMASAAGLSLVPRELRDPTATTTYGVGQMLAEILDHGVQRIVVGCGDSGTSDGGAGALRALGARILDANGQELIDGGASLTQAAHIDISGLHPRLAEVDIVLACNIHNVLTGPRGVAHVFGPQKGATPEQVEELARGLEHWADLLTSTFGVAGLHDAPGSGASGGLGAGLMAVGAQARDRFQVLLEQLPAPQDLDELIEQADLVITAEGAIDFQTPRGKVPAEVARRAQRTGAPVLALAGSLGEGAPRVHEVGISAIASIMTIPMALEDAVRDGRALLTDAAERTIRLLLLGSAVSGRRAEAVRARYIA